MQNPAIDRIFELAAELRRPESPRLLIVEGFTADRKKVAESVASHLGLPLLPLAGGAFIGQTEKNLASIITGANRTGSILFFDEADALFGKRTNIKDAHQRYEDLEAAQKPVILGVDDAANLIPSVWQGARKIRVSPEQRPR